MQAIKPYAQIVDIDFGRNVLKKIELVGRTCYKSTDKITEDSAPKFVSNLVNAGHEAMLEHASFAFILPYGEWKGLQVIIDNLEGNNEDHFFKCFLRFTGHSERNIVSGNVRAWRDFFEECYEQTGCIPNYFRNFIEQNPVLFPEYQKGIRYFGSDYVARLTPIHYEDLKTTEEILTHWDVTVRFVIDRGISHEVVRHRPASFAQESTRYCNYSKDKFEHTVTYIDLSGGIELCPVTSKLPPETIRAIMAEWWDACRDAEKHYFRMLELGTSPQIARSVLNNSTKTQLGVTFNIREWRHFFRLRTASDAHPQMREVANALLAWFKEHIPVLFDDLDAEA